MIMISVIKRPEMRRRVARTVLEALPEWFGIPEARDRYIRESVDQLMLAAYDEDGPRGFLCLKETGRDTMEISVMGVLKEYHRQGIGSGLVKAARSVATDRGYSFLQVKTVQSGRYPEYDGTNLFYQSVGFKEFEVMPDLWDEWNPCQIYVQYIGE